MPVGETASDLSEERRLGATWDVKFHEFHRGSDMTEGSKAPIVDVVSRRFEVIIVSGTMMTSVLSPQDTVDMGDVIDSLARSGVDSSVADDSIVDAARSCSREPDSDTVDGEDNDSGIADFEVAESELVITVVEWFVVADSDVLNSEIALVGPGNALLVGLEVDGCVVDTSSNSDVADVILDSEVEDVKISELAVSELVTAVVEGSVTGKPGAFDSEIASVKPSNATVVDPDVDGCVAKILSDDGASVSDTAANSDVGVSEISDSRMVDREISNPISADSEVGESETDGSTVDRSVRDGVAVDKNLSSISVFETSLVLDFRCWLVTENCDVDAEGSSVGVLDASESWTVNHAGPIGASVELRNVNVSDDAESRVDLEVIDDSVGL
ncbi:hypothetical protein CEP52_014937 [Fusarium oligoseptatum]|uniref:Uncharacterized protein n=1 Tax=Fusarium oligoseptatum TaxID=2604345 RepID=A0A428SHP3_9HYPO|nr:hypothetical protein CEP52_014937 [Fusarium oligoseptatum]